MFVALGKEFDMPTYLPLKNLTIENRQSILFDFEFHLCSVISGEKAGN